MPGVSEARGCMRRNSARDQAVQMFLTWQVCLQCTQIKYGFASGLLLIKKLKSAALTAKCKFYCTVGALQVLQEGSGENQLYKILIANGACHACRLHQSKVWNALHS